MYTTLKKTVANLPVVTNTRKEVLKPLIQYIQEKKDAKKVINLNFICTHNSRRSHLAQIWAQTMAYHYNISLVNSYSGGTETTNMNSNIVDTLSVSGFKIQQLSESNNPVYAVKYNDNQPAVIGFSKKYDSDFNPKVAFCAIMTCSQADSGCPFISGAEKRVPITFEDPKIYDNTSQEKEKYTERSLQIAAEMNYVFSSIS